LKENSKKIKINSKYLLLIYIAILLLLIFTIFVFSKGNLSISENDCIYKGKLCTKEQIFEGIKVKYKVSDFKKMGFYVINNDENTMTLLASENLLDDVNWYWQLANYLGPHEILDVLFNKTKNWKNVPLLTYSYNDSGYEYYKNTCVTNNINPDMKEEGYDCEKVGGYKNIVIKDGKAVMETSADTSHSWDNQKIRARLITKEEVYDLIAIKGDLKIPWLANTKSFWTMTSATEKNNYYDYKAYTVGVNSQNTDEINLIAKKVVDDDAQIGLRPVITVNKEAKE